MDVFAGGVPDFRFRATVSPDGQVSIPLIGQIEAAGLTTSQLQTKVQTALNGKVYRFRTPDGKEAFSQIPQDQVTVSLLELRPFYVSGEVARPGEYAFRAGMTVRKAIALAGGYGNVRLNSPNMVTDLAEWNGEYNSVSLTLAQQQVRLARLKAELDGRREIRTSDVNTAKMSANVFNEFVRLEREQLTSNLDDYANELEYLRKTSLQTDAQIQTLMEQQRAERAGLEQQAADLARIKEQFQKGVTPISRFTDEQRSYLLASQRVLQIASQVAEAQRNRESLGRQFQRLENRHRNEILAAIGETELRISTARSRLLALEEKLMLGGIAVAGGSRGMLGRSYDLKLVRRAATGPGEIPVDENAELLPGDVLEVAPLAEPGTD